MPREIQLYTGDSLSGARHWANLPEDELKRRAAAACRDRDEAVLTDFMTSYLRLRGKAGAHVSRHTVDSYSTSVRALLAAWKGQALLRPSRDAAALWVRQMEEDGKSASTVTARLAGARMLYAALRWSGVTDVDPFKDVKPARDLTPAHSKRLPYPDSDLDRLIAVAEGEDRTLLLLAGHTGLRVFECLRVRWQDVDFEAGTLWVNEGKGRKSDTVTMSRTLSAWLAAQPRHNEFVIYSYRSDQTARYRIRKLCRQTGVKYRAVHAMRHTAGTRLQRETSDIHRVARHLRHSSVAVTERYVHLANDALKQSVGNW